MRAILPALCLILSPLLLPAAEPRAADPDTTTVVAPVDQALLEQLSTLTGIRSTADGIWWGDQLQVIAADDASLQLASPIGPITADRAACERSTALAHIEALIAQAAAAGIQAPADAPLTYGDSQLTGTRLKSATQLILDRAILERQVIDPPDLAALRRAVEDARPALTKALDASSHDDLIIRVVEDLLAKLATVDGSQQYDEVPPSYARSLIRSGWLNRLLPAEPAAAELAAQVTAACGFHAQARFANADGSVTVEKLSDAFDNEIWRYSHPAGQVTASRPRVPEYSPATHASLQRCWLITERDPDDSLRAARLAWGDDIIARWDPTSGFACDNERWRSVITTNERTPSNPLVTGYLPPHLVISEPDGSIRDLITAHGRLPAIRDPSPAAAEAFLARATTVLPDAPHLDLIGQYLMRYVYDSPESTLPFVPGTRTVNSDIHQTATQTLLTSVGGICRGDCDDLSEVYHNILIRQGQLPHVISLPSHAACAWAEKDPEERWHVYVLQTGRAFEWIGASLPQTLVRAYRHFGPEDNIDPNGLGLLLRFSGENTRSSWRLSWRIFSEPDYAETMIDVQRDWHFQTYARAIDKMQDLIQAGDRDNANFRELAGLYSFTGQYALAAQYLEKAGQLTREDDSRLYMSIEIFDHWASAGNTARSEAALTDILDVQLPPLLEQLGAGRVQLGLDLLGTMTSNRITAGIGRLNDELLVDPLSQQQAQLSAWIQHNFDLDSWQTNSTLFQMRHWARRYARLATDVLRLSDPTVIRSDDGLRQLARLCQHWMLDIAPVDVDDPSQILAIYAIIGDYYRAIIGDTALFAELDAARLPQGMSFANHGLRMSGSLQRPLDVPWIKASLPFWFGVIADRYHHHAPDPDLADIQHLAKAAVSAYDHAMAEQFVNPGLHHQGLLARLILALVSEDDTALRAILRETKAKNDKRLRDDVAMWLGDAARGLDLSWYRRVIQAWREELDYKPKYYWIAWRAMLNHCPDHALIVAQAAAEHFADDPSFIEEYRFMRELANPQQRAVIEAEAQSLLED